MDSHSSESLKELASNMMKLVLIIFILADRLATPKNRNLVNHQIRGLLLTSRSAVPGGRDQLNQGKLQRVILRVQAIQDEREIAWQMEQGCSRCIRDSLCTALETEDCAWRGE